MRWGRTSRNIVCHEAIRRIFGFPLCLGPGNMRGRMGLWGVCIDDLQECFPDLWISCSFTWPLRSISFLYDMKSFFLSATDGRGVTLLPIKRVSGGMDAEKRAKMVSLVVIYTCKLTILSCIPSLIFSSPFPVCRAWGNWCPSWLGLLIVDHLWIFRVQFKTT